MHPLMDDVTLLTDDALNSRMNKAFSQMHYFGRTGHNDAYRQASNIYLMLVEETKRRAAIAFIGEEGEDTLGELIDIKKRY